MTRELLEGELSFADQVIVTLLQDTEKYQEDLLAIPEEDIRSTINKLSTTTSEFLAGLNVLTYRAEAKTEDALKTGREEIDKLVSDAATRTSTTYKEVDDELWNRIFDIERGLTDVTNMTKDEVDKELDRLNAENEAWKRDLGETLGNWADTLHEALWAPLSELTNEAAIYLAGLPAQLLFSLAKDFFFEED
ncbi:unnamed protein product [marine sediment metagenome]|uniref:Uncharacterized protein n=1 Tax=marine sediment metagenome TaxID=412755 RepID=X1SAL6_9ZZZZ